MKGPSCVDESQIMWWKEDNHVLMDCLLYNFWEWIYFYVNKKRTCGLFRTLYCLQSVVDLMINSEMHYWGYSHSFWMADCSSLYRGLNPFLYDHKSKQHTHFFNTYLLDMFSFCRPTICTILPFRFWSILFTQRMPYVWHHFILSIFILWLTSSWISLPSIILTPNIGRYPSWALIDVPN